jgi:hypothetical protein
MNKPKQPQTYAPGYAKQQQIIAAEKAKAKAQRRKPGERSYFEQAVDYGEKAPPSKEEKEFFSTQKTFRENILKPATRNLQNGNWKQNGINSDIENEIDRAQKAGYITLEEKRKYTSLASEKLIEARRSKWVTGTAITSGTKHVTGRNFDPDKNNIQNLKIDKGKQYKRSLLAEQARLALPLQEAGAMASAGAGTIAGIGLGAAKTVANIGRLATDSESLNDLYNYLDNGEKKYQQGVADGANENLFLESMYGSSGEIEKVATSPAVVGGELGRRTIGRGVGMLTGLNEKQQDTAYANLGIGDWYAERTGDPDNLLRQASALSGGVIASTVPGFGLDLVTMKMAGTAFAAATRPVVKTMIQSQMARTAGSMAPMAVGAVATAGIPGQVTRAFGGSAQQGERANQVTQFAGRPLAAAVEAIPVELQTTDGGVIDARLMQEERAARVDPGGVSQTAATVGLFGSGIGSFYKDARQLFKVNRLLAKANATQYQGRFLNAGDRLLREKTELIGSVGPDAAFGLNNAFEPIAQTYRSITDQSKTATGEKMYNPPTLSDIGRAALLTFTAVRPHGKLGSFITPALRGKVLGQGSDIKTEAMFVARDWVESGGWRSDAVQQRFKALTGKDAHTDDVKRVVSASYELIANEARQAVARGEVLPTHAAEIFFNKLINGRAREDMASQQQFNDLVKSMRVKGDNAPLSDGNPLLTQRINENIFIVDPKAKARAISELTPQVEKQMLAGMKAQQEASQPKPTTTPPVVGETTSRSQVAPRSEQQKFFGVRIEDTEDGVPQYMVFNPHKGPNGYTFRSSEIVRGDEDVSDLIMLDQATVNRNSAYYTAEQLTKAVATRFDLFNPFNSKNKWSTEGKTKTISGFHPDGTIIVKSRTNDGNVRVERMGSLDLVKELSVNNIRLLDKLRPVLNILNTRSKSEAGTEMLDYADASDFPDKVPYTSEDGAVKFVNGRLIRTSGGVSPMGIYQLADGTVYMQPLTGDASSATVKPPLGARELEQSPDTLNAQTIKDAQTAVASRIGYIRMDIHDIGMPTRVPVSFDVLDLIESVLEGNGSLSEKAQTVRGIIGEDYALSVAGTRMGMRMDADTNDLVHDVDVQVGDLVSGAFTTESDLESAIVIKSANNLVTVRLLSDPTGDAYTVPVDQVIVDVQQNKNEMLARLNNFRPSDDVPYHRPWTRTLTDEEEFNTFMALKASKNQRTRIENASPEELPDILLDVMRSGNAFSGDVKLGLISWAASNQNVEAVLDAVVGVFDDAVKPGTAIYNYLVRVSDLYGDHGFVEQLYYLDGLMSLGKSGALLSAHSIQSKSTAHAIARRMNILAYRSNSLRTPEALYTQAVKSLNIIDSDSTKRDALNYAYLLRGIAPHAAYHAENMWQMKTLSGASPEMQVFLGRAIAVTNESTARSDIESAGFSPVLTRFWTSERMYVESLKSIQQKISKSDDPLSVKEALSELGLEFLWYAATEQRSKNLVKSLNTDAEKYKEWQRKLNTYVTNTAIPTIILRAIESDITSGDFMGYVDENTVHQTNQVSFIQVIAKFGEDIARSVAQSEVLDETAKADLLTALNDLRGQIQDISPEMLSRIASYRPSNITGNAEYTLTSDGSANNISLIDYQQTVDRAVQTVIDQALTSSEADQIGRDLKTRESDVSVYSELPVMLDGLLDTYDVNELTRRSAYEKLQSNFAVTQLATALGHFKFDTVEDLQTHIARWDDYYGVNQLRSELKSAIRSSNTAEINRLKGELNDAKVQSFASAFKSFDRVLNVVGDLIDRYEGVLGIDAAPLELVYNPLRIAYEEMRGDYYDEGRNVVTSTSGTVDFTSSGGVNRVISNPTDADGTGEATTSDTQLSDLDPKELKEYEKKIKSEKEAALKKAINEGQSQQYQDGLATYYNNLLTRISGDTLATKSTALNTYAVFIKVLREFNDYVGPNLVDVIDLSNGDNLADKLTILSSMSADMLGLISKDIFVGPRLITQIKNGVLDEVARQYDRQRSISDDVVAMRNASAPIEITENIEDGVITLSGLTMKALNGRAATSELLRSIDDLNHDTLSNDPALNDADLMFNLDAADADIRTLLDPEPVIDVQSLESQLIDDEAFDGMVTSTIPKSERVKLYALHARNFAGMRTLIESLLLRQFDFESTDQSLLDLGESVNTQRSYMSTGSVSPERSGKLGEQVFNLNPFLIRTAQTTWKTRLTESTAKLIKDLNLSGRDKKVFDAIIPELVTILDNADAYSDVNTMIADISNTVARIVDKARIDTGLRQQIIAAYSDTSVLDTFNHKDIYGTTYSHGEGYLDIPFQIGSAIDALSGNINTEFYVSYLHPRTSPSILSEPTVDGLAQLSSATAEQLYKLYNKLDMTKYNQSTKETIDRIKNTYLQRSQYVEQARKVERDMSFVRAAKDLSTGLARAYDNFAYGYGKQQYAMLITSSLPEHRAIMVDAMVKVGVNTRVVDYFKRTSGSFESVVNDIASNKQISRGEAARELLSNEEQTAIATYLIAKGRVNYYLHAGKLMMTSSDLMASSQSQMITAKNGKLIHGAFLATQRLMMLSSDANGPRTADTLFHEMTHGLFTALDDNSQVRFLKSLVPDFSDVADETVKSNPLYPVVLQLKAIDLYAENNPGRTGIRLQEMWRDPSVVEFWQKQGMSENRISVMQNDWYNSGHELFATALQNFMADFSEPTSLNASSAMDADAAAIFQQVAGPIRSMWHQLSRANQPDIVLRNGKPYRSWASNVPVSTYKTGNRREISYPQVRQGDYFRQLVPNETRLITSQHDIFGLPDLLSMWSGTGLSTSSNTHKFGYQSNATFKIDGKVVTHKVTAPIDSEKALSDITSRLAEGRNVAYYVNPLGGDKTQLSENRSAWGQRFNGRIVDQLVFKTAGTDTQQTVFAYQIGGRTFSFSSMVDNDGVHDSGFFKTRMEKDIGYTTVPDVDSYFVIESPVELTVYEPNVKGTSRSYYTNARWIVSSKAMTDSTYTPQLLGYTGDYNPKFSAVLYDLNRKIDTVTRSISNYHSYQDQLKFEKQLLTGTPEDFRTDQRQGIDAAERLAAYWSDQGKDVRAAGVDMYAGMAVGRSSFENELLGLMRAQRLIDRDGAYTEEGAMFIDDFNLYAVNPLSKYIDSQRLFRNALSGFRFGEINADGSGFELRPGMGQYEAMRSFHQNLSDAIRSKASSENVPLESVSDYIDQATESFYTEIYNAINPRPVTRGEVRSNKIALQDRISDIMATFNSGLPDELQLTSDSISNGEIVDVVPILQSVLQSKGIGTSDAFVGMNVISELIKGIDLNQTLTMSPDTYQTNSAGYVLNRVTDVIFGRDNLVGKWEFMQRLASPDSEQRSKAMQVAIATSHILDLQERQINTARYKWNQYSLPKSAFVDGGKVRITDSSGRTMLVDFNKNTVQNIGIDFLRPGKIFKADVHSSRYPLFNPDADINFMAMPKEKDADGNPISMAIKFEDSLVKSMSEIEKEQYQISKDGIVIMRDYDVTDPNSSPGIYLYRVNKISPKQAAKTGVHFSVDRLSNPFTGYHISGDGPNDLTYVNNQRVMKQSPSKLMFLAMQRYFDNATSDNYDAIERIRKTSIIQPEIYIAKLLVARAQREAADSIPDAWKTSMRDNFKVKRATANAGDETYDVLQSVSINNRRTGTWLSSGDLQYEGGKPFTAYENDLLRNLPELPPQADNNQELIDTWRKQRYELIEERLEDPGSPKNIIFKRHSDNDQVGIAVDGSDIHITIPSARFKETINVMFSSSPTTVASIENIPDGGGASMPLNSMPPDYPIMRAIFGLWTELSGLETAKRLSRDFARPMIQNYALTALNPKNKLMQFYGLLGMAPNLWLPHGNNRYSNIVQKLFGHQKERAYGDQMYHKIIQGMFRKYGTKGSVTGYGLPFIHRATVTGFYDRESETRRSYTIADLNELGLSTTYGEWYEAATAAQAMNPMLSLEDTPIQLTGAENLGGGVIAQRVIPFVGQMERGGVLSTDLLRIKQFLEIARVVDLRIFDHLSEDAWGSKSAYYEAEQHKRKFARIINTISGSPVGEDPDVHQTARELGYALGSIYTAPNWGKSLKAFTYVPMMMELGVAHGINFLLRPIWRKVFDGAEYNTINVGAYHNYLNAISTFTTAGKRTLKTPGTFDLFRKAATIGEAALLWTMWASLQTNIQERALLASQGKPTAWYELGRMNELMTDMNAGFEDQQMLDFKKPGKFGKVITLGNMQIQAPPIVMGLHRFVLAPYAYMQQRVRDGESPIKAFAETMLRTEITSRVNAMYTSTYNQLTGRSFNNAALFQQHPGFYRFLQNPEYYKKRAGIYALDLYRLQKMYPRGASRLAIDQEILPVQKLMQDLELMELQPNAEYNHGLAMGARLFGVENNYANVFLQNELPAMKTDNMTIGQILNEKKNQEYDYPNAFDMISQFGLWSLFEGIPGSGDIGTPGWGSKQPTRGLSLPTQAVVDVSKLRSERMAESLKQKEGKVTLKQLTGEQITDMYKRGEQK